MNLRSIIEVAAPAAEPITLVEAKQFCRVTITAEDALITAMIVSARRTIEQQTGLSFVNQSFKLIMPRWDYADSCPRIILDRSPLVSITEVKYYDSANTLTTFAGANYRALVGPRPGALELDNAASWPDLYDRSDAVQITFVAGFGAASTDVPANLVGAVKLLTKHYYDNRDAYIAGTISTKVDWLLDHLVGSNRVGGFIG